MNGNAVCLKGDFLRETLPAIGTLKFLLTTAFVGDVFAKICLSSNTFVTTAAIVRTVNRIRHGDSLKINKVNVNRYQYVHLTTERVISKDTEKKSRRH